MKTHQWLSEEIALIVTQRQATGHHKALTNHNINSVHSEHTRFLQWQKGKVKVGRKTEATYQQVLQLLRRGPEILKTTNGSSEEKPITSIALLDEKINEIKELLADVIAGEVERHANEKIRVIKEEYEVKLQDMQKVLIEARSSSIVGLLREKWSNKFGKGSSI